MSKLVETKSLLAKLMATENIHIEQKKVSTASFDLSNRVLTVPIFNDNIDADTYDLFMGHEVGHALFTDFEAWKNAADNKENMSVLNVVEDYRIEKKIKYKYPGLKNVFVRAYNGLFNRDFFKTKERDLNTVNFIDRINLHTKVGASLNIQFNDVERDLIRELESIQTFEEAVLLQRKIVDYIKEQIKEEEEDQISLPLPNDMEMEISEQDGEGGLGDEDDDSGMGQPPEEQDNHGNASEDEEEVDGEESEDEDDSESNGFGADSSDKESLEKSESSDGKGAGASEEDIRAHTDDAFKENESKLFDANKLESVYVNAPKVILDKIIIDFKDLYQKYDQSNQVYYNNNGYDTEGFIQLRNSINKTVSYLVKEFELRKNAEQMKKTSTAKTGDLNMNKIYSYQFNEDVFKKLAIMNQGKSHGLVIFIDWSGSMEDHLFNTIKQLFNIVMFCKKVNIPYEVYGFSDHAGDYGDKIQVPRQNDLILSDRFKLLNILSSRMNAAQFTKAASALIYVAKNIRYTGGIFTLGGTPLNDTILAAMDLVPQFQKKNNLQIVNTIFLTDGDSNTNLYAYDHQMYSKQCNPSTYDRGRYVTKDMVIRDNVTRFEVTLKGMESGKDLTAAYLKLLKRRTNANVVGFYILSNSEVKSNLYHYYPQQYELYEELYSSFKKNNHLVITSQGYDEYYLLKSDKGKDDDETFEVRGKTTKSIANAFAKFAGNKMNNRTVLNRFIGLIS